MILKLKGKQVKKDQDPELRRSCEQLAGNATTTRKYAKSLTKSVAPLLPKCQKRGRKKHEPTPSHCVVPVPIQPKLLPSRLPYHLVSVPGSVLHHVEPAQHHVSVITPSKPQILNVMSLDSGYLSQFSYLNRHETNSYDAPPSVLNANENSVIVQGSFCLNEVGNTDTVVLQNSASIQQFPGISLPADVLISSRMEPSEANSLKLNATNREEIRAPSSDLSSLVQGSSYPAFFCYSDYSSINTKIRIPKASNLVDQPVPLIQSEATQCPISSRIKGPICLNLSSSQSVPCFSLDAEKKFQSCKSKPMQCSIIRPDDSIYLQSMLQGYNKGCIRLLVPNTLPTESPVSLLPSLVEHSNIGAGQTSKISELASMNTKSTRRGRQKRIPFKRCAPVPIQPKLCPAPGTDVTVHMSIDEFQASDVLEPIHRLEIASCDMNSFSQKLEEKNSENPYADCNYISPQSSSVTQNCIVLKSIPTRLDQVRMKTSNELSHLSHDQTIKRQSASESSVLSESKRKSETCIIVTVQASDDSQLKQEIVEEKTFTEASSTVKTASPSQHMSSGHSGKTFPIKSELVANNCTPQSTFDISRENIFGEKDDSNSTRPIILKRKAAYQKSEKDMLILGSSCGSKRGDKSGRCHSTPSRKTRRKNSTITGNETCPPSNSLSVSVAKDTCKSKYNSDVPPQRQEKISGFVPILPRPINDHTCIFNQAVVHKGRRLWDYLFKKKLTRKIRRNFSAPNQGASSYQRKRSPKINSKQIFVKNALKVKLGKTYKVNDFVVQ